jgi:hypothetical protein
VITHFSDKKETFKARDKKTTFFARQSKKRLFFDKNFLTFFVANIAKMNNHSAKNKFHINQIKKKSFFDALKTMFAPKTLAVQQQKKKRLPVLCQTMLLPKKRDIL